mgnify:CR=1 FL=1
MDARGFQIAFLCSFLALGALARDFALGAPQVALTFAASLSTQAFWLWRARLPGLTRWSGYLSPIVSSLGICILVRADNLWVHPLVASLAMSSKFLIRAGPPGSRSHVLNPANLAAFVAWACLPGAWLSPGQWGADVLGALWFIALGGIVTRRVGRLDIGLAFLLSWAALLAARLWWLDYAWDPGFAMWLRQCGNGAVLLFAFFMISDPLTTPRRRAMRIGYAAAVALAAFAWQFGLYRPHGLIVALFAFSWLVPLLNRIADGAAFSWEQTRPGAIMRGSGALAQSVRAMES